MAASLPAKLKDADIAQFALRAGQLEKFKPIVSYWLRFYMTQRILAKKLHTADEECTMYTTNLMEKLEQTKAEHASEDALLDEVAAYAYCEQFALDTFARADNAMRANKVTAQTVDTLRAAATFFEMLTVWKNPLDPDIASKLKFAKYHTIRIVKALKAGEDPNLSNPVQEAPPAAASPPPLDPNDPEVRRINEGAPPIHSQNPYQSYVESAPNTSTQPSPNFSPSRISPPPELPGPPTGYSHQSPPPPQFGSHRDVSPISQPGTSRHGSVASVGGGYFPRVDVPTFTADNAAPGLPTASSVDEHMTSPFDNASVPQAPQVPDAQTFYQDQPSAPPPQQPPHQYPLPQNTFQNQQPPYASPPPPQPPPLQQPQAFQPSHIPPQQNYQYTPQPQQPPHPPHPQQYPQQYPQPMTGASQQSFQGPFRTDEDAVMEAQKRAKWAISALNFEDVPTAVKELRMALKALGAN
ncbi:Vta1 like-domain-containing protein [Clohesyomyces aquaticus]|uniref:Vta1 like-domain-containing protein n=1 Tax=Clohesyomyces aquaticus TaxID=1231657 RepID=A0A1Y1YVC3_9PLEO|nr:Vta1 like-domain-containing protein [Clohesyomyces aquaticus]